MNTFIILGIVGLLVQVMETSLGIHDIKTNNRVSWIRWLRSRATAKSALQVTIAPGSLHWKMALTRPDFCDNINSCLTAVIVEYLEFLPSQPVSIQDLGKFWAGPGTFPLVRQWHSCKNNLTCYPCHLWALHPVFVFSNRTKWLVEVKKVPLVIQTLR